MATKQILEKHVLASLSREYDTQKKLIKLRERVNRLHFREGYSKNDIAVTFRLSKHFVVKWTQSPSQNCELDNRGWPMGRARKWGPQTKDQVKEIHQKLKNDPQSFYWGPTAIQHTWKDMFPGEEVPPVRTIGKILKEQGLTHPKERRKGAASYLCYPEHTVYNKLGNRVMEADFIGQKYLQGRTEPLHFIGFSFKKDPKLRYYRRIEAPTATNFIQACSDFFSEHEKPDCIKVDNAAAYIGSHSGKRNISRVMDFLLDHGIHPVFSVPRRPFTQASIEGNNSVFSRKFWNRRTFSSVEEIDTQLEWFNRDSKRYTNYQPPSVESQTKRQFEPKVYFLRQVQEASESDSYGTIDVLNEDIILPSAYINLFVLAEWDLTQERLCVYLEKDKALDLVTEQGFSINPASKKKRQTGALSYCN